MNILVFLTDAFGGRGGIAKFNRDLLAALCRHPATAEVIALPRVVSDSLESMPPNLEFDIASAGGLGRYLVRSTRTLASRKIQGVVVGHLNLLPLGAIAAKRYNAPLLLVIHGIEAWNHHQRWTVRAALRRVDAVVSVSEFTKNEFLKWSRLPANIVGVIPNCVDLLRFRPGLRRADLVEKYDLLGCKILLTVARLSSAEKYKGVDRVLKSLPRLSRQYSNISYLVVGEGDDRPRLEEMAAELKVSDKVRFVGHVPESEKADHFRLADAFVMPGTGEGFGLVYLEALACGIPVVASSADASSEAVLGGALGEVVNPHDSNDVEKGILRALSRPVGNVPDTLQHFSTSAFLERWAVAIDKVFCQHTRMPFESGNSVLNAAKA